MKKALSLLLALALGLSMLSMSAMALEFPAADILESTVAAVEESVETESPAEPPAEESAEVSVSDTAETLAAESGIPVDETHFPDPVFRAYVLENIAGDDSVLSDAEIANTPELDLYNMGIRDMTGLEHFTALTYLYVTENELTELDVSRNTALEQLYCGGNYLTELDLSGNPALRTLDCRDVPLSVLDIRSNETLCYIYLNDTPTVEYDYYLYYGATVDGSWCVIYMDKGLKVITGTDADVTEDPTDPAVQMFPDPALRAYVLEHYDTNSDGAITPDETAGVTELVMEYQGISDLTGLEQFSDLTSLNLSHNRIIELDLSRCPNLETVTCTMNYITSVKFAENAAIKTLTLRDNYLENIDISGLPHLTALAIGNNSLSQLDTVQSATLTTLSIYYSNVTELDVTGCPALTSLTASSSDLATLDIAGCTNLKELSLGNTKLTELELSSFTALEKLILDNTNLSKMDFAGCTNLKELSLADTNLTELDISAFTALERLTLSGTNLAVLDIRGIPNLLNLYNNKTPRNYNGTLSYSSTTYYPTYLYLCLYVPETTLIIAADPVPGDADGDGASNTQDLVFLMRGLVGQETLTPVFADLNGDKLVDILDVIALVRLLAQ